MSRSTRSTRSTRSARPARSTSRKSTNLSRTARTIRYKTAQIVADITHTGHRVANGTLTASKSLVKNTAMVTSNTVRGTARGVVDAYGRTVGYGESLTTDFIDALQDVMSGLVDGASTVVRTTGDVTEQLLTQVFDVRSTRVFNGAGKLARQIANDISGVVRRIPYVGQASGYVVESVGGGVYHVILSVGALVGSASRRLGKIAKKTSDLVVFTLGSSNDQLKATSHTLDDLVRRLSHSLTVCDAHALVGKRKSTTGSRKTAGGTRRGGGARRLKRRRLSKRRGGGVVSLYRL
jgi:hypothetical protein